MPTMMTTRVAMVPTSHHSQTSQETQPSFEQIDLNHDGLIDREELNKARAGRQEEEEEACPPSPPPRAVLAIHCIFLAANVQSPVVGSGRGPGQVKSHQSRQGHLVPQGCLPEGRSKGLMSLL